jgi:hypothetical protein
MENKKKTTPNQGQKPVHTIRRGAIAANIWQRQTQTGMEYYDYSLSRSWKSQNTGKEGYSTNFFPGNRLELIEVVTEATEWIAAYGQAPAVNAPANAIGRIEPVKVPASEAR